MNQSQLKKNRNAVVLKDLANELRKPPSPEEMTTAKVFGNKWKVYYSAGSVEWTNENCPPRDPKVVYHKEKQFGNVKRKTKKSPVLAKYIPDSVDLTYIEMYNEEAGRPVMKPEHLALAFVSFELDHKKSQEALVNSQQEPSVEEVCNVCRSPNPEDGNELVFCDNCNVCVHQACYGVITLPVGPWYCDACSKKVRANCNLCPEAGGAFKSDQSGHHWVHVSCALWIPQIKFGCPETMCPVLGLDKVSTNLHTCCRCLRNTGATIKCSSHQCNQWYHVTCALSSRILMIYRQSNDDVMLQSYCDNHAEMHRRDSSCFQLGQDQEYQQDQVGSSTTAAQQVSDRCRVGLKIARVPKSLTLPLFEYWFCRKRQAPDSFSVKFCDKKTPDAVEPERRIISLMELKIRWFSLLERKGEDFMRLFENYALSNLNETVAPKPSPTQRGLKKKRKKGRRKMKENMLIDRPIRQTRSMVA